MFNKILKIEEEKIQVFWKLLLSVEKVIYIWIHLFGSEPWTYLPVAKVDVFFHLTCSYGSFWRILVVDGVESWSGGWVLLLGKFGMNLAEEGTELR